MVPLASSPSLFLPADQVSRRTFPRCKGERTFVFKLHLDIKYCDDLALALAHIHVAIHAHEAVNLRADAILFGRDLEQVLGEVVLRPWADILVHPVPVIWVVEDHGVARGIGACAQI